MAVRSSLPGRCITNSQSSTDEALQGRLLGCTGSQADEEEGQDLNEWKGTQLPGVGAAQRTT